MKKFSPQGPTTLECPTCGNDCHFKIDAEVILCSKCNTKSRINSKPKIIRVSALLILISTFFLCAYLDLETVTLFICLFLGMLLYILLIYYANISSMLVKIEKNT